MLSNFAAIVASKVGAILAHPYDYKFKIWQPIA